MCKTCRHDPCSAGCPNYTAQKARYFCSYCEEGICAGDEYIKNINGEYVHKDCIPSVRWLLDWLQYDIKIMEVNDYE